MALRGAGWTALQIAHELEISRSYASELYLDPTGERARARKARYAGTCQECGSPTYGGDGRAAAPKMCERCTVVHQHEQRYWTRERVIESFQEFHRLFGRSPAALDTSMGATPSARAKVSAERNAEGDRIRAVFKLPLPLTVTRELGSWNRALEAAGLPLNGTGAPTHRSRR
jgi:hypothetical protein